MVYKIREFPNRKVRYFYDRSMEELEDFYKLKIVRNRPRIIIIEDRAQIDSLKGLKTEDWLVGWSEGRSVFLLNQSKTGKESREKYDDEKYKALIQHELSHSFLKAITGQGYVPIWLNEGVAISSSGQNKFKKPVGKFHEFLEFYDTGGHSVYWESGFAIETLIKRFGKEKLLSLLKKLKSTENKIGFLKAFKDIYGFRPSYSAFNRLK